MDRKQQIVDAVRAAEANGWEVLNGNTVRRMTTHETPASVQGYGWWPEATYHTIEFITFVFGTRTDRVPAVVYKVARCPWVGKQDQRISYRKALELLAQPLAESDVHN